MDAVDELVHQLLYVFENRLFAHAALCDLSRAFETVYHADLSKLERYGISRTTLSLFKSYLTNRRQKFSVGVKSLRSEPRLHRWEQVLVARVQILAVPQMIENFPFKMIQVLIFLPDSNFRHSLG
ncbi:hypothetical protein J6590_031603 [Homalodisca vitripennis]|nr:hypothetical protein J6590_031603 [Homalodisca vitripennis]